MIIAMVKLVKLNFNSRSAPLSAALFLLALPLGCFSANPAAKRISIPAGTHIDVQLTTTLSSSANQRGDPFLAEIEQPIFADGAEVIPAGSTLRGHVTFIRPPGRVKGKAQMRLVADGITTKAGKHFVFAGQLGSSAGGLKVGDEGTVTGEGKSKKQAIKDSAIGAGAGAAVGVLADGGQGALYGAGIGAVAVLIHSLAKHHNTLVLDAGTEMSFITTAPMVESSAANSTNASVPFICSTCQ